MRLSKRALGATVIAFGLLATAACGGGSGNGGDDGNSQSQDGGTLRLGHVGSPGDVFSQSVEVLDGRLQELTEGRWKVENYGSSQLGNERDLIEGVSMGTVDMTLVTNPPIGNFVEEAMFFDLPGLYESVEHVHKVVADDSIMVDHVAPAFLEKDLRLLGTTDGGFRVFTNNGQEIRTLDDLAGIKIRVQESPVLIAAYEATPGVTAVPIPMGDLYSALDQGVVVAQENPAIMVRDFNFAEVQENLTVSNHSYFPRHILINEKVWQSISEEDQEHFQAAIAEMVEFKNAYYVNETDAAIEAVKEAGMNIVEPDPSFALDYLKLMEEDLYPQFYERIGGGDATKGEEILNKIISYRTDQ